MLDILTIVHSFADVRTASRIRRTCRRLAVLIPQYTIYSKEDDDIAYEYRVGSKLHRLDGPARVYASGCTSWYREGIAHREYHPQYTHGLYQEYITYRVDGVFHRETGPSIMYSDTAGDWYMRSMLHRKTAPAYERWGGSWYTLGKSHRLDGPTCGNIYTIRGRKHCIFRKTGYEWRVDDLIIRRDFSIFSVFIRFFYYFSVFIRFFYYFSVFIRFFYIYSINR